MSMVATGILCLRCLSLLLPGSDVSGVTEVCVKLLYEMHGCDVMSDGSENCVQSDIA